MGLLAQEKSQYVIVYDTVNGVAALSMAELKATDIIKDLQSRIALLLAQNITLQGRVTALESKIGLALVFSSPLAVTPTGIAYLQKCPSGQGYFFDGTIGRWACSPMGLQNAGVGAITADKGTKMWVDANGTTHVAIDYPLNPGPAPGTEYSQCALGQWTADAQYLYVCVASGHWKRVAFGTW